MLELRYEEVARLFTYDRETGVLYWRIKNHNSIRRNYVAGSSKGTRDGENIFLGRFETLEEAAAARAEANLKFNFHNNHGKGRAEYVRKKANARLPK